MTTRVFVTLLMLVQVLACPFLECGECTGACAAAQCAVDSDACCQSESPACDHESDPCDDPVCPDNPGGLDCLCGGAVQTVTVECPDLLAGSDLHVLPDATLTHSTLLISATSGKVDIEGCPHFPPLMTGTSLCALTQTYLL